MFSGVSRSDENHPEAIRHTSVSTQEQCTRKKADYSVRRKLVQVFNNTGKMSIVLSFHSCSYRCFFHRCRFTHQWWSDYTSQFANTFKQFGCVQQIQVNYEQQDQKKEEVVQPKLEEFQKKRGRPAFVPLPSSSQGDDGTGPSVFKQTKVENKCDSLEDKENENVATVKHVRCSSRIRKPLSERNKDFVFNM